MRVAAVASFLICAMLVTTNPALSFGRDDEWTSGWGQGVAEAIVTHGPGNQIYVTCNDGGSPYSATEINFTLGGDSSKDNSITLTFDGDEPKQFMLSHGSITSDCHACMSNYLFVIDKFKTKNKVHVLFESGVGTSFTLKGAKNAISQCTPDFAR